MVVEALINAGAKVNMTIGKYKSTPLIRSIYSGNLEIIKKLLKAGATDKLGNTSPLLAAIKKDQPDIITTLSQYGVDMNNVNPGQTDGDDLYYYRQLNPLEYAITSYYGSIQTYYIFHKATRPSNETLKCIKALIQSGTSLNNASSKNKFLPLNFAIYEFLSNAGNNPQDCIELLNLLIKSGAKINLQDPDGSTALHRVLGYYFHLDNNYEFARVKFVKYLLDMGADPNIKDNTGKTPLALAQSHFRDEIIKLLKQHGAIDARKEVETANNTIDFYLSKLDTFKYHTFRNQNKDNFATVENSLIEQSKKYPEVAQKLSDYYGSRSWYLLFALKFREAEQAAKKGLSIKPANTWIKLNLAHSLLFQNKYQDALKVYLECKFLKDEKGKSYASFCLEDFDELEKHEMTNKDINKIRVLLKE